MRDLAPEAALGKITESVSGHSRLQPAELRGLPTGRRGISSWRGGNLDFT